MLNIAIWLAVGAVVGLVAGLLMRGEDDAGVFVNVAVGIVGALVAGWLVAPHVGVRVSDPTVFNIGVLAIALIGAVALLGVLSIVRGRDMGRGRKRREGSD